MTRLLRRFCFNVYISFFYVATRSRNTLLFSLCYTKNPVFKNRQYLGRDSRQMCTMLFSMGQLTLRLTVFANAINSQSKQVQHREYCALRMKISVRDNKGPKIKFPLAREFICPISFSHADWRDIKTPKNFSPPNVFLARSLVFFVVCVIKRTFVLSYQGFCRCLSPIIVHDYSPYRNSADDRARATKTPGSRTRVTSYMLVRTHPRTTRVRA